MDNQGANIFMHSHPLRFLPNGAGCQEESPHGAQQNFRISHIAEKTRIRVQDLTEREAQVKTSGCQLEGLKS